MSDSHHEVVEGSHSREIRAGMIAVYMAVAIGFLGGTLFVMENLFAIVSEEEIHAKVLSRPSKALEALRVSERETLTNYKILDKDKGRYQIPVSEAMTLVSRDYAARRGTPAPATIPAGEGVAPSGADGTLTPGAVQPEGAAGQPGADAQPAGGSPAGSAPVVPAGTAPASPGGGAPAEGGHK